MRAYVYTIYIYKSYVTISRGSTKIESSGFCFLFSLNLSVLCISSIPFSSADHFIFEMDIYTLIISPLSLSLSLLSVMIKFIYDRCSTVLGRWFHVHLHVHLLLSLPLSLSLSLSLSMSLFLC